MKVKNLYLVMFLALIFLLFHYPTKAQTVEFFDDFESGVSNWSLTNNWGLSSIYFNSGANSLTESPAGNYTDSETSYATMANAVDLSAVLDANLSFWAIYDIEGGFDFMYVDVSGDGGSNWVNIASFDGENNLTPWIQYTYSLGGFVGSANVIVRFRFESDVFVTNDGMYIDDFEITSNNIDNSPPLILHTPPFLYEASLSDQNLIAEIIDVSGISVAELIYTVDGGVPQTISGVNITGDDYLFVVPQQLAGSWIDYWITATDASDSLNSIQSDTYGYVSGNYLVYDNAQVDFVNSYGPASPSGNPGAAVRITLPGTTDLVTCLIRNYTDINRPNDSMLIHVWDDGGGIPGTDLITPFMVFPEATLAEPNRITRVDLRPYSAQLSNLSGDVFIGFTVPSGEVWVSQTTPGIATRTFIDNGSSWINITDDYHFRAITDTFAGVPIADFGYDTINDPLIVFADSSTNSPTSWFWDFGDLGATSILQNPSYTFSANGAYNVCLTATNSIGSDTKCRLVTISKITPIADFTTDNNNCTGTIIQFTDLSSNFPTSWYWDFGDGATDTIQNPTHSYADTGTYTVSLIISNSYGSDTVVMVDYMVIIQGPQPPACTPTVLDTSNDVGIYNVSFNTINNTTGNLIEGYQDYSCFYFTTVIVGSKQTLSVETAPPNAPAENVRAWIDFNNDGTFNNTTELVFSSDNVQQYHSGLFIIPSNAVTDTMLRMRVASDYYNVTPPTPCAQLTYGQAEDYGITIQPNTSFPPEADFTYTILDECQGIVEFNDYSSYFLSSWSWDFGDGNSDTASPQVNNTYLSPGTYNVTLIVTNSFGSDTVTKSITIRSVIADFAMSGDTVYSGDNVNFTDNGMGANSWGWDFGDGGGATIQNPTYSYDSIGTYTIWLIASNTNSGCMDSISKTIVVIDPPPTGINAFENDEMITIVPIPSSGILHINYEINREREMNISIYDILGQKVYDEKIVINKRFRQTIDLTDKPKGIYFIKFATLANSPRVLGMADNEKHVVRKIILE